jgi:alpha-2-macroglobulin
MIRFISWQRITYILAFVLLFALGVNLAGVTPANMAAPSAPQPQTTPAPSDEAQDDIPANLPPILTSTDPGANASWLDGTLTLTFDQPLAADAVSYASIRPDLAGEFTVEGPNLIFTPATSPEAGTVYTIRLDGAAESAAGIALGSAVEATFATTSPLRVTSTQPSDDAAEVDTVTQLLVVFNRPVVALTGVDDQAELPNPLTIEPAVEGEGEWLTTSIFAFQPDTAFAGATTYTAVVDGVQDLEGLSLAEPYEFTFTTAAPIVDSSTPSGNQVRPDTRVQVIFTQPMDPESTTDAFSVRAANASENTNEAVAGDIAWNNTFTTLTFTPTNSLDFGATYLISVEESAQPASRQGTLRSDYSRNFTVVPTPAVQASSPVQGAQEVSPDATVIIRFNAPVSPTLVANNVSVSPMLTTTQVFSYYSEYLNDQLVQGAEYHLHRDRRWRGS